jgi:hypothetical protein
MKKGMMREGKEEREREGERKKGKALPFFTTRKWMCVWVIALYKYMIV